MFQEISSTLRRLDATLNDAAEIIARDAAMTANIMKLVNSAFFGSRQPIASIERAVAYLGLDTLQSLVLGHGVFKSDVKVQSAGFDLDGVWRHSLHAATIAKAIAKHENFSSVQCEEAFLVGLLHDVGKVVMATREDGIVTPAALDACHGEVGAYLLGLWGFPNTVVQSIAGHHSPDGAELDLTTILHVADRIAHFPEHKEIEGLGLAPGILQQSESRHRVESWIALSRHATGADQAA